MCEEEKIKTLLRYSLVVYIINIGLFDLRGDLQEKLAPYKEADFYTMEKIFNASGKNGKEIVPDISVS